MEYGNTVTERIANFERIHGASVYDGVWLYFEDGARREGNPLGPLMEPPDNPQARQQNIVFYHKLALEHATDEFDALKKQLLANPGTHPDTDANLARLAALRATARRMTTKFRAAQEELKRLSPGYRTPDEEAQDARNAQATAAKAASYAAALDAITI